MQHKKSSSSQNSNTIQGPEPTHTKLDRCQQISFARLSSRCLHALLGCAGIRWVHFSPTQATTTRARRSAAGRFSVCWPADRFSCTSCGGNVGSFLTKNKTWCPFDPEPPTEIKSWLSLVCPTGDVSGDHFRGCWTGTMRERGTMGVPLRDRTMKISFGNEPRKTPERKTNLAFGLVARKQNKFQGCAKIGNRQSEIVPREIGKDVAIWGFCGGRWFCNGSWHRVERCLFARVIERIVEGKLVDFGWTVWIIDQLLRLEH